MKLVYVANARMPTEKAHGIQIMKTCEAISSAGVEVELWLPKRRNPRFAGQDIFSYYNIPTRFSVRYFPCWDLVGIVPKLGFYIQARTFAASIGRELSNISDEVVFYCRDQYALLPLARAMRRFYYEVHTISDSPRAIWRSLWQKAAGMITITQHLADKYAQYVPKTKIAVASDGVDLKMFTSLLSQEEARVKLGIESGTQLVLYTGHLYEWKGARVLAQASAEISQSAKVCFVGGTSEDIAAFKQFCEVQHLHNTVIVGHRPQAEIPLWLAAANVVVIPNSGKFEISRAHTSPLKLFEYMASGCPIVASDLPSLREVLDESTAIFYPPDDPSALARSINTLLGDKALQERLSVQAALRVKEYTWDARAQKILQFINAKK